MAGFEATARSLSLMIQALSEAARFNDVEGTFRAAMN
ncbi:ribosome-inactivating family protein, partial [Kitasatospora sp. NPDC004799]